ncbi:MAG: DMT family transporter [Sphaerochaetaceae bacterium]|nr:DMT family transporter [Sphaerochaetaceae bacterium]
MNNERRGYLFVFIAGFLWGTIGLFVKQLGLAGATADTIALLRVGFSFLIMFFICIIKLGPEKMFLSRRNIFACALLGIITQAIYNLCYSRAIEIIGVSFGSVLLYVSPVFTLLFSMLLFSEKLTLEKGLAILMNILGCVLTVTNGNLDVSSLAFGGIFLGLAAGFCYSLAAIIGRIATEGGNPLLTAMYSFFFASIFILLRSLFVTSEFIFSGPILVWGFIYALIATSLTYIVYYRGVEMIKETSRVPVIASVEVVVASLIGVALYKERIGAVSLVGILLVISSIAMLNFKFKR